jgi:hypothetical protein
MPGKQFGQMLFVDGALAAGQDRILRPIVIYQDYVVTELSKAHAGNQTDISRTNNANVYDASD